MISGGGPVRHAFTVPDWSAPGREGRRRAAAVAIAAHLVLAAWMVRHAPVAGGGAAVAEAPLPVVLLEPAPPPPVETPPASEPEHETEAEAPPEPAPDQGDPPSIASDGPAGPVRAPDLVFVVDEPEFADPGTPRVSGTAGVSLPELLPESRDAAPLPTAVGGVPLTGWVVLRILVRRDGTVGEVQVVQAPSADVGTAVSETVRRWTFRPSLERGRPVDAWYTLASRLD